MDTQHIDSTQDPNERSTPAMQGPLVRWTDSQGGWRASDFRPNEAARIERVLERIDSILSMGGSDIFKAHLHLTRDGWTVLARALLRADTRVNIDEYNDSQFNAWWLGVLMGTNSDWWVDDYDPRGDYFAHLIADYFEHLIEVDEVESHEDDYPEYLLFCEEWGNEFRREWENVFRRSRASLRP